MFGIRRWLAVGALAALVSSGCGSGRSTDDLLRAQQRESGEAPAAGSASGGVADTTPSTGSVDGSVPVSGSEQSAPAVSGSPISGAPVASGAGAAPARTGASSGSASAAPKPAQAATAPAKTSAPGATESPGVPRPGAPGSPSVPAPTPGDGGGPKLEVRLGSIGTTSGPVGTAVLPMVDGAKAWASDVNARGGLNGHPVRLIFADDAGDPAKALGLAKRLVEQDKIHAFYATHAPVTEEAYTPYAAQRKIPIVGTCGCSNTDGSPIVFHPGVGSPNGVGWSHILHLIPLSDKRNVALLYCREVASCKGMAKTVEDAQQSLGFKVVYKAQVSLAQPDYTAEVLAARNAGADAFSLVLDDASNIRLARAAKRQNYNPVFVSQYAANDDRFLKNGGADIEGFLISALFPDYATSPKLADYRAAMDKYVPGGIKGGWSAIPWAAGKLLERIAGSLGADPTSEEILDGLYALKSETLGGLVPPLTFLKDKPNGDVNKCVIGSIVKGGKFVYPNGDQLICAPGWKPVGS